MKEINLDSASIIDVRSGEEFNQEHYPGAINIPLDEIMSNIDELSTMEKPLVVYCRSGNRSRMAVHIMNQSGITGIVDGVSLDNLYKMKNAHV